MKRLEWLRRLLTDYQWAVRWVVVATAAVVAFVFGLIGYHDWLTRLHEHDPVNMPAPRFFDVVFDSFALFVLGAAQGTGMPTLLEIAPLLAPTVVGSAALIALYTVFRDRRQRMRIPLMSGHVVVCGLGVLTTDVGDGVAW